MRGRPASEIPEDEVRRLYCDERLSTSQIARRLGWSDTAVRNRLIALGIPRRTPWARNAVACDIDEVQRLYVDERLSAMAISKQLGCSERSILRRLIAAGIERRPDGAVQKYARHDFSGDPAEKAYLIGLRIGDLNVELKAERTILVKCTSTRSEQIELFRTVFERYGHVYTDEATLARRKRQSIGMQVALNLTFEFLLEKDDCVPDWILDGPDEVFFAFVAGYMDAEGYIRTYLPRGYRTPQVRVEIRSYDGILLDELAEELNRRGVTCPPADVRVEAGYVNGAGVRSNGVTWGIGIFKRRSLLRLFERIDRYLRHPRRRRDMLRATEALNQR
jgi:hypothetical protein